MDDNTRRPFGWMRRVKNDQNRDAPLLNRNTGVREKKIYRARYTKRKEARIGPLLQEYEELGPADLGHADRFLDSLDLAEAVLFQNHANGINGGL